VNAGQTAQTVQIMRVLQQLCRVTLLRRFITSLRDDGWRVATAKAQSYFSMQRLGSAQTVLRETPTPPQHEAHYFQGIWQQLAKGQAFHLSMPAIASKRRFVAIVGDLNLPQCRKYRVEQLASFWNSQGVTCEFAHFQDLPRVARLMSQATHLAEYRLQSNPLTEMLRYEARRLRLPILYDIDDPLFSISAYETYGNMAALDPWMKSHFLTEAPKYLTMMNGADIISVSTPGLAKHASLYCDRPIHVRRNYADADTLVSGARAHQARGGRDGIFRVAFASGSLGHDVDFAQIASPVERFILGAPNRRLLLLGHVDRAILSDPVAARTDTVPFSTYDAYLDNLARADCAVMPLADDAFNQCKSAVRVIDASAASVPSIVGTVGDLEHMISDGDTGHVARSPEDWFTCLTALATDPKQTALIGKAARQNLEARWSGNATSQIIAPELIDWVTG
jgi:glycosyltransferase involved in cell wall biosynthesis